MTQLEYKAVALPQLVPGKRRKGQESAEVIAEMVSKLINAQAERGWAYSGSDSYRAMERRAWWSRPEEVVYTVLLFEREVGAARTALDDAPRGRGFDAPADRRGARPGFEVEEEDDEFAPPPPRRGRAEPRRRLAGERDEFEDRDFDDRGFDDRGFDERGYDDRGFDDRDGFDDEPSGGRFGGGRMRRPR